MKIMSAIVARAVSDPPTFPKIGVTGPYTDAAPAGTKAPYWVLVEETPESDSYDSLTVFSDGVLRVSFVDGDSKADAETCRDVLAAWLDAPVMWRAYGVAVVGILRGAKESDMTENNLPRASQLVRCVVETPR